MNSFKIKLDIKNFTYGWFIFSILSIILLASLQAYFDYKRAIQDTKISTSNITMLLTKKFENDFEQAENILKLAEYFVVNLPKDNINFYSYSLEKKQALVNDKFKFLISNFIYFLSLDNRLCFFEASLLKTLFIIILIIHA